MTLAVSLTVLVYSAVASEEKQNSLESISLAETEGHHHDSLQPHTRNKRTIGHIFDMFKSMMDNLFGGKGGKGRGKGKGKGRGKGKGKGRRPKRPGQPPSGGYGAPQAPKPSYGRPAPPQPPPPPRNPGLSGGYAGGQAPQRPQNNYGGPQQAPSNNYGGPQQAPVNNYGAAPQAPVNNYAGAQQQAPSNFGGSQQNVDSYGSPQAAPIANQDSYGSPQGAPVGPIGGRAPQRPQSTQFGPSSVFYDIPAPNLATEAPQGGAAPAAGGYNGPSNNIGASDSYGSPQAAPVGANQDSYGSPQAAPIGGGASAPDSYGSPQAAPVGPNSAAPDSYGSPQAAPIGGSAPDSYGSPQGAPVRGNAPVSNNPFTQQASAAPDSYGTPQSNPFSTSNNNLGNSQSPQFNSAAAPNTYGSPQAAPVSNSIAPATNNNPFIQTPRQPAYGSNSAAPLPVTGGFNSNSQNDLSGNFVPFNNNNQNTQAQDSYGTPISNSISNFNADSYGGPVGAVVTAAPAPVTALNIPDNNPIVIAGRAPSNNNNLDIYGSVAPVGTSAPVPEDVITDIRAQSQDNSFASYSKQEDYEEFGVEDVDRPEGELASTQIEEDGQASPLFEDLRGVSFTSPDTSTEALDREPIQVDLSQGVVDLTNGLDQSTGPADINLAGYNNEDTTPVPSIDDEYTDDYEYEYIGEEDVPPEIPKDLIDIRNEEQIDPESDDESLANGLETEQESYGKQEASVPTGSESDYEYYYDYEEEGEYYYDDEQLPDSYSPATTVPPSLTTLSGGSTQGSNFISVPLMIEEVAKDTAPVILAGTSTTSGDSNSNQNKQATYGNRNTKRRAPLGFNQFLVEAPQTKRQAVTTDWSSRLLGERRNRVWRQFNLD